MQKSVVDLDGLLWKTDDCWAEEIFKRDILYRKISEKQRKKMIQESLKCGAFHAENWMNQPADPLQSLLSTYEVDIRREVIPCQDGLLIFAQFHPPGLIVLNEEVLNKCYLLEQYPDLNMDKECVEKIILAHELFHLLEEQNIEEIYTRNQKIVLWKLGRFKYQSTINALSEIGAMAFSKAVNQLEYSPCVLEYLFSEI